MRAIRHLSLSTNNNPHIGYTILENTRSFFINSFARWSLPKRSLAYHSRGGCRQSDLYSYVRLPRPTTNVGLAKNCLREMVFIEAISMSILDCHPTPSPKAQGKWSIPKRSHVLVPSRSRSIPFRGDGFYRRDLKVNLIIYILYKTCLKNFVYTS
jgi:hypothetical protein